MISSLNHNAKDECIGRIFCEMEVEDQDGSGPPRPKSHRTPVVVCLLRSLFSATLQSLLVTGADLNFVVNTGTAAALPSSLPAEPGG